MGEQLQPLHSEAMLSKLEELESALAVRTKALGKAKSLTTRVRGQLTKPGQRQKVVREFVSGLRELSQEISSTDMHALSQWASEYLQFLEHGSERRFMEALAACAITAGLETGLVANQQILGPFALNISQTKEEVGLVYAKEEVLAGLPVDAASVVQAAVQLRDNLFEKADDARLAYDIEEAILVSLARGRQRISDSELRSELPCVYREMVFIRRGANKKLKSKKGQDYSLARFAVELATLLQGEQNVSGPTRFRLETAVIENTRNKNKSVFVPRDLSKGYGEGTYYQAILMRRGL